ncbi:hypothetical protein [Spongiactinospora sp. 9N601]|uniref:hypothetical protein n=1 Tax=Spongiactinospora sp. 9N601 TaxID=3375149 RepID=UPI0037B2E41D
MANAGLTGIQGEALRVAMAEGMRDAAFVIGAGALLAVLAALALPRRRAGRGNGGGGPGRLGPVSG